MSKFSVAEKVVEYAMDTPAGRVAGDKLLELGRRMLQSLHRVTPVDKLMNAVGPLLPEDLEKATKIASTATERIGAWHPKLAPEFGAHLTDPNVVLTIGEARGQTEFHTHTSVNELSQLNAIASKTGIEFEGLELNAPDVGNYQILLTSRTGLQDVTAGSKLNGLPKFFAKSNEKPFVWLNRAVLDVDPLPHLTLTEDQRWHVAFGVMKGYPDSAILSMRTMDRKLWTDTRIKNADYYDCAQPNFVYNPHDADGVARTVGIWGEALTQFYKSPVHREIKSQTSFVRERLKSMDDSFRATLEMNKEGYPLNAESSESSNSFERALAEADHWRKRLADLK